MYQFIFSKKKEQIVPHEFEEELNTLLDKIFLSFDKDKSKIGGHEFSHEYKNKKTTTVWMEQPTGKKVFCLQTESDNQSIRIAIRGKWDDVGYQEKLSLLKNYNCDFSTLIRPVNSQYKLCLSLFNLLLAESKERTNRLVREINLKNKKKIKESLESFI